MKRTFILTLIALSIGSLSAMAQQPVDNVSMTIPQKVYDESINQLEQIDNAVAKAKSDGKYVICQLGGNWCPWCLRFADYITKDSIINKVVNDNFVYIHVNYPGRSKKLEAAQQDVVNKTLARLNNAGRFGFPVLVVLNEEGKVIHIQDSSYLEEGQGYDHDKTLRFFQNWTSKAVKGEK